MEYPRASVIAGVTPLRTTSTGNQKKRTLANRFWNSKIGEFISKASSNGPLPEKSTKVTKVGGTRRRNYNLRAAQFLSERSPAVQKSNLKLLPSKRNKNTLRKALNKTRRNK
jgi:hypothetical protein